ALLAALGEVIGSTAYAYAVLPRERAGRRSPGALWVMRQENTRRARGRSQDREDEASLTLAPDSFTLRRRSAGPHDCSDLHDASPPRPGRWGATLFALDPAFDLTRVTRPEPVTGAPIGDGEVLVRLNRVGNDEEREAALSLSEPTDIRVYAIGEIVPSESYDYGWIEDAHGNVAWE